MKKVILRIGLSIFCLVLGAVHVLAGNTFMYYPHYKANKKAVGIQAEASDGIRMMSCNLRCISPTDWGKKGWFYRADMIIGGTVILAAVMDKLEIDSITISERDNLEGYILMRLKNEMNG